MSTNPTTRRILLAGLSVEAVGQRLRGFGEVFADLDAVRHTWRFAVSQPMSGWLAVDLQPTLAVRHAHNLAVWIGLADPAPRDLLFHSTGEGDWDYWLTRGADPDAPHVLAGATGKGLAFQVDCVSGARFDAPSARVPPLPTGLAMLNRGVPVLLQKPGNALVKDALTVDVSLPAIHQEPWSIPEPARLADELEITRSRARGGSEMVIDFLRGKDR